MNTIIWEKSADVVCTTCKKPLTIPYAHIHFHYGSEGLSENAKGQLYDLVGKGHGDDVGFLGQDICMSCLRNLIELVTKWKGMGDANNGA